MSKEGPTAGDLVNTLSQQELAGIIYQYGEDRNAGRIARGICEAGEKGTSLHHLSAGGDRQKLCAGRSEKSRGIRPEDVQALGIAERRLDRLRRGWKPGFHFETREGSQFTFHSLEDRIVKHRWQSGAGVYLSQRLSGLCLRQNAAGQADL